jgi:hypothetical protein
MTGVNEMNVKDFIQILETYDPEMLVVMSSDSEGNNYSPFSDFDEGYYIPYSTYSGEMYFDQNLEEEPDEYDVDEIRQERRALVLFPIN